MLSLSLSLLGHLAVSWDKRPLTTFRSNRIPALMVYLTVEADRPHRRETLMELLWPGLPAVSARQNLRQTLYLLRQEIPELTAKTGEGTVPLVLSDRHTIQVKLLRNLVSGEIRIRRQPNVVQSRSCSEMLEHHCTATRTARPRRRRSSRS
jgi:hypothetical protein